jgi:hypothetical protein
VKKSNVSYQKSLLPCNEEKLTDLHVNIKKHGDVNGNKKEKTGSDSNNKDMSDSQRNGKKHDTVIKLNRTIMETRV